MFRLKKGNCVIKGFYNGGKSFKFENVDYDEAVEYANKVKQAAVYDDMGKKLYEHLSIE